MKLFKQFQQFTLSNINFENTGNDLNDEANAGIFDTESCLSSKMKRNKRKPDQWSNKKII